MYRLGDSINPQYLDAMAELIKQNKQRSYSWMHIQPGHAVLDVGCGPGIDTLALAGLVGPTGRQLYGLFKRLHFIDINVEIRPHYFTNYAQFRYGTQMDIIEHEALATGFVTEEELNRWQQNLEEAEATGTFFAHAVGVLVAGRKAKSTSI